MAGGVEGETSRRGLPPQQSKPSERAEPNSDRVAASPLVPRGREQQRWEELPHEQLVQNIRSFITREQLNKRFMGDPEGLIQAELSELSAFTMDKKKDERANQVWRPVAKAWDIVAYDQYGGMFEQNLAAFFLSDYYQRTHESNIRLTETQTRILDALTEAVGIPHQRGQTEIVIPEKLRDYAAWRASPERRTWNVHQARAEATRKYHEWMATYRSAHEQRR
jgi:hypothetical protein